MSVRTPAGMLPIDLDWLAVNAMAQRYAVGVVEIDRQHRMLFAWYVALRQLSDSLQVVEGLIAYAAMHFDYEEEWANGFGVDVTAHHDQHHSLLYRLGNLLRQSNRGKVLAITTEWITTHIEVEDRALIAQCPAV